jgi:beta-lactam-binding protein with PASTA domain/serine/threonine protein kinase
MVSSAVNDSLVGRELDARYRVMSHLADGGMATVYVAMDTRLDREIALKVMRPHLADDDAFVSRFRREARSAARLSHPNVVAVFDQGEDAGQVFLAMEYVPGHTLRQVLTDEGALTPRAALDILDSMLQALAAAHRAGIVHRDVKPENVILREDGVVKVADFGLARAVTSQSNTSTGMILGTVAYLSPEQVERSIADVRSDVYAAGLVLFEMLTGEKAFTGETPIQIAYQHVHGAVPTPSSRIPTLSPALDALVASATARDPDRRPADADAYLAEVRRVRSKLTPAELDQRPQSHPNGTRIATGELSRTAALPLGQQSSDAVPVAAASVAAPPRESRRQAQGTGSDDRVRGLLSGPWRWPAIAAGVLLVAALLAWFFLAGPGASTRVPNVVGKTAAVAKTQLEAAHLRVDPADAFNEKVPKGVVISTDPASGREVGRSTKVTMTVSLGPERYAVPSLIGHSPADAQTLLTQAKLAVGNVTEDYSEKVTVGLVMASNPGEGKLLKPGTAVDIVVSKGRQPIEVQDFTGKPADDAVKWITDAGLKVKADDQQWSDTVPKGSVISQDPTSGIRYRGDTVTLVVSKGPEVTTVPNVAGKNENEAKKILEDAGFQVKIERFMGGIFGTVRSQDPPGDSQQPKGTTITLIVV